MSAKFWISSFVFIGGLLAWIVQIVTHPVNYAQIISGNQFTCLPDYLALIVPTLALGVTLGAIACTAGRAFREKPPKEE